jgi:hypothetical protein
MSSFYFAIPETSSRCAFLFQFKNRTLEQKGTRDPDPVILESFPRSSIKLKKNEKKKVMYRLWRRDIK